MNQAEIPEELVPRLLRAKSVAILTGAGMSAESGIPTFRDASNGLWQRFNFQDLASPAGWKRDKALVWAWYEWRRGLVSRAQPNAGHIAIANLASTLKKYTGQETPIHVVTQNVDDLHERAGHEQVLHVHGSLFSPRCSACRASPKALVEPSAQPVERIEPPVCERCGGYIRPGVVWFGEVLDVQATGRALKQVLSGDVLLVIGTSGAVYPVAEWPRVARERGVWVCEINPSHSEISSVANACWRVAASTALPFLISSLSSNSSIP